MKELKLFIDGEWTDAQDGATFESIDPAKGEPWAKLAAAGPADAERALKAARRAYDDGWGSLSANERADYLEKVAELIWEKQDDLVEAESKDMGSTTRKVSIADVTAAAQIWEYYAELIRERPFDETFESEMPVPSRRVVVWAAM